MSIDLEYAIKQDIRNNPVVREVDRAQRREFLRTLGWAGLLVAMLVFALAPRTNLLETNYRTEELRDELVQAQILQRQLRLELEVALRPQELERRAVRDLQMVAPSERDTVVLELVPARPPASRAIVASAR
jgi:hypothetical protein